MSLSAVDIFCGAGGLSLGLHVAGWDVVAAIDYEPDAILTYHANFPNCVALCSDVSEVDFRKYEGIDLLAGGPPCQPFSVAGKQKAQEDHRDMVPQFIRAIREAKPKLFLMENVPGLMTPKHIAYLASSIESMRTLGYKVSYTVLNAAEYGAPQNRRRLVVIGCRNNRVFNFPIPTHGPKRENPFRASRDCLGSIENDIPNNVLAYYADKPVLRPSPFAGMLVNGQGRPFDLDGLCHTIPATAGGNRTHIVDASGVLREYHRHLLAGGKPRRGVVEGVRRLTFRESARIQTFPDTFCIQGTKSKKYLLVGNAVPPLLAEKLGYHLMDHILGRTNNNRKSIQLEFST